MTSFISAVIDETKFTVLILVPAQQYKLPSSEVVKQWSILDHVFVLRTQPIVNSKTHIAKG